MCESIQSGERCRGRIANPVGVTVLLGECGGRMTSDERSAPDRQAATMEASVDEQTRRVFSPLLQELTAGGGVQGGGVWRPNGRGMPACLFAAGSGYERWAGDREHHGHWDVLRNESLQSAERRLIPLAESPESPEGNPQVAGTLVHWPFDAGHGPRLLELLFDPAAGDLRQREVLRHLQQAESGWNSASASHAVEHAPQSAERAPRAGEGDWDEFLLRLHRSLSIDEICYTIANDGRRLIGADRVCVLVQEGARLRLASVSGVDLPDRRSNVTRTVEAAAAAVMQSGRRLVYSAESGEPLPPQLDGPLSAYADANHVRAAIFAPLPVAEGEPTEDRPGALIVEWFVQVPASAYEDRAERLAGHAGTAVHNGLRHADVAWAHLLLPVQWARSLWRGGRRKRTLGVVGALVVAAALLAIVPAPLVVTARGQLQPVERRHIYAPVDGIVDEVQVDDESPVQPGDTLVVLSNPELDLELQRVVGAIDIWEQKLASLGFQRLDGDLRDDSATAGRMSGEEAEAREELLSLRQQQALLEKKQEWLTVTAPIAGHVSTWNVRETLRTRPVRTGERLLTVADLNSGWELELLLDERAAGHAVAALAATPEGLKVEFLSASGPERTHRARLREVAETVYWQRGGGGVQTPATAVIDEQLEDEFRAGTTVSARIDCGHRSLGYVWFHSLYEAVVRRLWY